MLWGCFHSILIIILSLWYKPTVSSNFYQASNQSQNELLFWTSSYCGIGPNKHTLMVEVNEEPTRTLSIRMFTSMGKIHLKDWVTFEVDSFLNFFSRNLKSQLNKYGSILRQYSRHFKNKIAKKRTEMCHRHQN